EVSSELRFSARLGLAQSQLLAGELEAAETGFAELLSSTRDPGRRAVVIGRQMRLLQLAGETSRAVELGLAELGRLGVQVPKPIKNRHVALAVLGAWRAARKVSREQLLEMAEVRDERIKAQMHIFGALSGVLFSVDQLLFIHLAGIHARLVLTEGYHSTATVALAELAFAIVGMGQVAMAGRLAEDNLALAKARGAGPGPLL
ncbi:MAG: hypothetical protein KC457_36360, partial [Myxococcales bacterium]|nr:hypothetical protein [Myxococcales bacterium]